MGVDDIRVGGPGNGKKGRSTGTAVSVEEEARTAGEEEPNGAPGEGWVLTA